MAAKPRRSPARTPTPKAAASGTAQKAALPAAPKPSRSRALVPVSKPKPVVEPKSPKQKPVRDSFTMPPDDYALIAQIKQRALKLAHPAKKSEVLRAGLQVLAGLGDPALAAALAAVPSLKTGRPKKDEAISPANHKADAKKAEKKSDKKADKKPKKAKADGAARTAAKPVKAGPPAKPAPGASAASD